MGVEGSGMGRKRDDEKGSWGAESGVAKEGSDGEENGGRNK